MIAAAAQKERLLLLKGVFATTFRNLLIFNIKKVWSKIFLCKSSAKLWRKPYLCHPFTQTVVW